jgi:hypothetical protein
MITKSELQRVLDHNQAFSDSQRHEIMRVVEFIISHNHIQYFPMSKIKHISGCDSTQGCLDVATYLCGERLKLLVPRYCYIEFDGKELSMTQTEFKNALKAEGSFVSDEYGEILSFSKERLNIYFAKVVAPDAVITELEL